jgi:FKBP-type peptidyl-prolyl cis-trans isomerase 2
MKTAKQGDSVKIIFTGHTENGAVFEATADAPVEFTIGDNQIISGLEKSVVGMQIGEKKALSIPPEEAFGLRQEELVEIVNKDQFPSHIDPKVGQRLRLKQKDGEDSEIQVTKIEEDRVTLDANHPLSGETLEFEIELIDIQ